MKHLVLISVAAGTILSAALSLANAQTPSPDPSAQQVDPATPKEQGPNSGTAPGNMGTSGWTGGSQGQTHEDSKATTGSGSGSGLTPGAITNDTQYSTGTDLQGPAARFPSNKTPE